MDNVERCLVFKVILAGDGGVGKTTLLKRIITGNFIEDLKMTIGLDISIYRHTLGNNMVDLQLWDIAGQDQFRTLVPSYLSGANLAILMYDLTAAKTVFNLETWIKLLKNSNQALPTLIVGTKKDLIDHISVTSEEVEPFIKSSNAFNHMKISSKTGTGIQEVLNTVVQKLVKMYCIE